MAVVTSSLELEGTRHARLLIANVCRYRQLHAWFYADPGKHWPDAGHEMDKLAAPGVAPVTNDSWRYLDLNDRAAIMELLDVKSSITSSWDYSLSGPW